MDYQDVVARKTDENEIPIEDLPIQVKAYKDENGYALVLKSEDKRISNSKGKLVDNFLVRIIGGEVPMSGHAHQVAVSEQQTRHVEVADAHVDENGRLFVTNAADGVKMPSAQQ